MTCKCEACQADYRVDVLVPNDLWERIKPFGKPQGGGLLCGPCIMGNIEALDEYAAFHLVKS